VAQRLHEADRLGRLSLVSDRRLGARRRHASCAQVRHGRGAASVSRRGGNRVIVFCDFSPDALVCRKKPGDLDNEPTLLLVVLAAGITISLGMVCIYYALDLGKVSVVIPISSTGPFFSLLLAAVFLRDVEKVTLRIVASAVMIVGGVVLLTLWR
jgi:drug/metabolite transporter (DMT)-like permease